MSVNRSRRPVQEMSDGELLTATLDTSSGTGAAWGCYAVFAVCIAAAVFVGGTASMWSSITSAFCPAAFVALMAMVAWTSATNAIHCRTSAPYRQEFMRRSGVASDAVSTDECRVVLMLSGRALPHGGTRTIWVTLTTMPAPTGELVHASVPYAYASGSKTPRVGEAALPPLVAADVVAALDAAIATKARPKLDGVRDGFPFTIEVHRGRTDAARTFSGNLAARNWREDAACRLADSVLRAADVLGARREPFGACSDDGEVTLGER